MSVFRCPQCANPMTQDELRTGACPLCEAPVDVPPPTAAPASSSAPEPPTGFSLLGIVGMAISILAFCLVPVGLMFYFGMPEPPEKKPDNEKPAPKAYVEAKKPEKKKEKPKEVATEKKTKEHVQPPPVEKKKVDQKPPVKKKEEVKTKEPKKEEPKVVQKQPEPMPKPMPLGPKRAFAALPLLTDDAIKIDGDLSDWKGIPHLTLLGVDRGKPTKRVVASPRTQKAQVAYNQRGIFIALDIVDTSGELENPTPTVRNTKWDFWNNDAIEVFIDTKNTRAGERGQQHVHQFVAFPFGTGNDAAFGGYESRMLKPPGSKLAWSIVPIPAAHIQRAAQKTPAGWTMELFISRAVLRQGDLKPGQVYGFEMQIDTGTNLYYFWANDDTILKVSTNPSRWGEALLAGTDAAIEWLTPGRMPAKTLAPGQPLTIRVTDLDMNLNPAAKEKVNVTLISKSGDRNTLLLEETGVNTGVFAGTMATRLNTGKRAANVLEVLADDTIAVEYLDAIRANGDRNKSVSVSVTVKSR